MDLFVLAQQLCCITAVFELGHLGCQNREDVLLFNCVVCPKVGAQLDACIDELLEGKVRGTFVCGTRIVEEGPGLAEVVMLFSI